MTSANEHSREPLLDPRTTARSPRKGARFGLVKRSVMWIALACERPPRCSTIATPYVHVEIHNPMATSVVVSVYNSVAPGRVVFATGNVLVNVRLEQIN